MTSGNENITASYDDPWKEALEQYFQAFIAFFFVEAHHEIDWSRGYEFLDKEFQQIVREAEIGKRFVDKLVKVWLNQRRRNLATATHRDSEPNRYRLRQTDVHLPLPHLRSLRARSRESGSAGR